MTTTKIMITQDHWDRGMKAIKEENNNLSACCVMAQAMKDAGVEGRAGVYGTIPPVGGKRLNYSPAARKVVEAFDAVRCGYKATLPELPVEVELTEEGK